MGILWHLHAVLSVQKHGQVVLQAHHRDCDGAQRGQRYRGAQVRGTDGELQRCLWPDSKRLFQPDHTRGGLDGKVAFSRVRERINHLGIGAWGGRQSALFIQRDLPWALLAAKLSDRGGSGRLLAVRPSHVGVLDEGGVQDLIECSCEGEGYSANP